MENAELFKINQTPVYIYDIEELDRRIAFLRKSLPERVEMCYAMKANSFIVGEVSKRVDSLEICSPGELRICKRLGLPVEKYVISGVYKDEDLMAELIADEVQPEHYTAESVTQFVQLREIARQLNKKIPVLLRLTSGNQFGMDESEVLSIIGDFRDDEYVHICGVQFFSGTQKTSLKKMRRELVYVDAFLQKLREEYEYEVDKLEFGPGFPVAYFEGEDFEEGAYLAEFANLLSEMQYQGPLALELGRSIAASCGTYMTKVVDAKCNKGENYAIVDGGMHQIVYYGQSMAMKHPKIRVLHNHETDDVQEWNICGSLCTINDILVKRFPLANLQIGDVLVFENTGAYCVTEGISLFLSRDLPTVMLRYAEDNYVVVRDAFDTDVLNTPQMK